MQCNVKIRSTVLLCCVSASADLTGQGQGREGEAGRTYQRGEVKKNQPNYPGELLFCSFLRVKADECEML